jgi:hypothetical protein
MPPRDGREHSVQLPTQAQASGSSIMWKCENLSGIFYLPFMLLPNSYIRRRHDDHSNWAT